MPYPLLVGAKRAMDVAITGTDVRGSTTVTYYDAKDAFGIIFVGKAKLFFL
jgi:hypothetical protein